MAPPMNNKNNKNKTYECDICKKSFSGPYVLQHHMNIVHQKIIQVEKKHQCPACEKKYSQSISLEYHIKSVHGGQNLVASEDIPRPATFRCAQCRTNFLSKPDLHNHIYKMHQTKHPYKCSICKEGFLTQDNLVKHKQRFHEGLLNGRINKCHICDKYFSSEENCKKHITEEHTIMCDICDEYFAADESFMKHVEQEHIIIC